mmetsp:Transcript_4245/g.6284  ORF Transcript_4245/g.6284 Transcript_4245/m.6284 type:complete len:91 (-) Transcript_4245:641-913(-)
MDDEGTQLVVCIDAGTFSFVDNDINACLPIIDCAVSSGLFAGNGGVALDESGHDLALELDSQRQRSDIKEKEVCGSFCFEILSSTSTTGC